MELNSIDVAKDICIMTIVHKCRWHNQYTKV